MEDERLKGVGMVPNGNIVIADHIPEITIYRLSAPNKKFLSKS
jgi:hypothetical protein